MPNAAQFAFPGAFSTGKAAARGTHSDGQMEELNKVASFYGKQAIVLISLDMVVFLYGKAVGDDKANQIPRLKAWLDAERDIVHMAETASSGNLKTQLKDFVAEAENSIDTQAHGGSIPASRRFFLEANRAPDYSRVSIYTSSRCQRPAESDHDNRRNSGARLADKICGRENLPEYS